MGLLDLCEKYFNSSNLYEVLQIPETASEKEGKKATKKSFILNFVKSSHCLQIYFVLCI